MQPRRRAFIIDIERAAPLGERAVVDDGAAGRRDALADAIGEGRGALAVEVAFQTVADGLVQQNAGPSRPEHHGHGPAGAGDRLQIHQRLTHGFASERERSICSHEIGERVSATAPA